MATAAAEQQEQHAQHLACPCLNVRLKVYATAPSSQEPQATDDSIPLRAKLAHDHGIVVMHTLLTAREMLPGPAASSSLSGLRCLNCGHAVYSVVKAQPAAPARIVGFQDTSSSNNTTTPSLARPPVEALLKPVDGVIFIYPCCLDASEMEAAQNSPLYSSTFKVIIISNPTTTTTSSTAAATTTQLARRPSFNSTTSSITSLPPVPTHLLFPPTSANTASPSRPSVVPVGALAHLLESQALEALRAQRSAAEEALRLLATTKRTELETLQVRLRNEAQALLERSKAKSVLGAGAKGAFKPGTGVAMLMMRSSSGGNAELDAQSSTPRRDAYRTSPTGAAATNQVAAAAPATTGSRADTQRLGGIQDTELLSEKEELLPSSTFERRRAPMSIGSVGATSFNASAPLNAGLAPTLTNTTSSGGTPTYLSQSVSALSASFAMRGRDPPPVTEWATKRRLRERYPEGDHSALTSAATSAATSVANSEDEVTQAEEEGRGRGRERTVRNGSESTLLGESQSTSREAAMPMGIVGSMGKPPVMLERKFKAEASLGVAKAPTATAKHTSLPLASAAASVVEAASSTATAALINLDASSTSTVPSFSTTRSPPMTKLNTSSSSTTKASTSPTLPPLKPARKDSISSRQGPRPSVGAGEAKKVAFAETTQVAPTPVVPYLEGEGEGEESKLERQIDMQRAGREKEETRVVVDEEDAAVFDIDEDIEREEAEYAASSLVADSNLSASNSGAGANSPIKEEAVEEEDDLNTHQATSSLDDVEDGFVPASISAMYAGSFSALAAATATGRLRSPLASPGSKQQGITSLSVISSSARELEPDFDPASLRIDGRVVTEATTAPERMRAQSRERTTRLTPSSSAGGATGGVIALRNIREVSLGTAAEERSFASVRGGGGTIGFRVAVGEAEARLSGLLAPNVPSHRRLWTTESRKKSEARKYHLDENDDDKWTAWQLRVRQRNLANGRKEEEESPLARSMPIGIATPPGGARSIFGQPGYSNMNQTTTIKDGSSGFDLEPKTSLPYQEKKMTPSLRKALRRSVTAPTREALPTIQDVAEGEGRIAEPIKEGVKPTGVQHGSAAVRSASHSASPARGALPGSVTQRGFAAPGSEATSASIVAASLSATQSLRAPPTTGGQALSPAPTSSGSLTPLAGSTGRRSPRPAYVPPPPPISSSLVLQPDPLQAPASLALFSVPRDATFTPRETGEVPESDWSKVLHFMHRLERLKLNKRTGWLHHRIVAPESIADHMYRMALLAMLCPNEGVDIGKAVQLALVHDLAEAEVGDLTPLDGVSKEEKIRREAEAIAYLVHDLLGSSPAALRIEALWNEYEERATPEARLVKDLDRYELCLQAVEYERSDETRDLQPFFSSLGCIAHPVVRAWAVELARERMELWKERGMEYEENLPNEEQDL